MNYKKISVSTIYMVLGCIFFIIGVYSIIQINKSKTYVNGYISKPFKVKNVDASYEYFDEHAMFTSNDGKLAFPMKIKYSEYYELEKVGKRELNLLLDQSYIHEKTGDFYNTPHLIKHKYIIALTLILTILCVLLGNITFYNIFKKNN